MMKSVARTFSWASPSYMLNMYVDDEDVNGIKFWYDDVLEQEAEIERNKKK